ncbi:hypothetical protein LSAT2_029521 [Lamellibrachia satsuma]|nr:hypothetical protein LSAT2_029521 [Lamellibrachia satsuma]
MICSHYLHQPRVPGQRAPVHAKQKLSFFLRTIIEWNRLLREVVFATTLDSFEARLQLQVQRHHTSQPPWTLSRPGFSFKFSATIPHNLRLGHYLKPGGRVLPGGGCHRGEGVTYRVFTGVVFHAFLQRTYPERIVYHGVSWVQTEPLTEEGAGRSANRLPTLHECTGRSGEACDVTSVTSQPPQKEKHTGRFKPTRRVQVCGRCRHFRCRRAVSKSSNGEDDRIVDDDDDVRSPLLERPCRQSPDVCALSPLRAVQLSRVPAASVRRVLYGVPLLLASHLLHGLRQAHRLHPDLLPTAVRLHQAVSHARQRLHPVLLPADLLSASLYLHAGLLPVRLRRLLTPCLRPDRLPAVWQWQAYGLYTDVLPAAGLHTKDVLCHLPQVRLNSVMATFIGAGHRRSRCNWRPNQTVAVT